MTERTELAVERALVTGAAGFIGSRLCARLVDAGVEVHAVSRRQRETPDVRWWTTDVGDTEAMLDLARQVRPDVLFHLASHVSGSRALDAIAPTLRANLVGAVSALLAGAELECHVVLTGSFEEPDTASGEFVPVSPYAAAKVGASTYARMFRQLYGTSVVTLRVFMVYGPGQWDEVKLVPYVITSFLRGESPLLSSGARPVDWVFVDDVVDALVAAARAREAAGETFDVGTGVLTTVREVVDEIARQMDTPVQPRYGARPDPADEPVRSAALESTATVLGWRPQTTLASGLGATIEWYTERARS
jgi:UDP-glucose 4-epimerase